MPWFTGSIQRRDPKNKNKKKKNENKEKRRRRKKLEKQSSKIQEF